MKHRSVIAFVIVAAALFSLPQLSHDLLALKGAVGARLHRELLHAFLNLPAGEPTAAAPVARPAETLLASCTREKDSAPAAKSGRASGRVGGRVTEKGVEQHAMIGDPAHDPINQLAGVEIKDSAGVVVASLPEFEVETAVAMIVPPENGIDPRAVARALSSTDVARAEADGLRAGADGLRVAYAAEGRVKADDPEWQKSAEQALREFNSSLPGAYQFRVLRDGAKAKVFKYKCNECPSTLPRAPRHVPAVAPLPAPSAPVEWAGE